MFFVQVVFCMKQPSVVEGLSDVDTDNAGGVVAKVGRSHWGSTNTCSNVGEIFGYLIFFEQFFPKLQMLTSLHSYLS